jgi:hypothetical protein
MCFSPYTSLFFMMILLVFDIKASLFVGKHLLHEPHAKSMETVKFQWLSHFIGIVERD